MIQKPFLAKCSNRDISPQENQATGSPEAWFDNSILRDFGKIGFSFDFFFNWAELHITPVIWVKRLLEVSPDSISDDEVKAALMEFEGEEYLLQFSKFSAAQNLRPSYLLFREIEWGKESEDIIVVSVKNAEDEIKLDVIRVSLNRLKTTIQAYSGGAVWVGAKGLTYGTSKLECYLSTTDSAYPGDTDLVVADIGDLTPELILEYKKHTKFASIPFNEQQLGNYYPKPDRRKYDRFAALRDYLTPNPILMNVFYPTTEETQAKIEIFGGKFGSLSSLKSSFLDLPTINNLESYRAFANGVISFK